MSGSSAIPPIRLTVEGSDVAARAMDDIVRAADRMGQRTQAAGQQMGTLGTAADSANRAIGLLQTSTNAASAGLVRLGGDFAGLAPLVERVGASATGLVGVLGRGGGLVGVLGAVGVAAAGVVAVYQNWDAVTRGAAAAHNLLTDALGTTQRGMTLSRAGLDSLREAMAAYARAAGTAASATDDLAAAQLRQMQTRLMEGIGRANLETGPYRLAETAAQGRVAGAERRLREFQESQALEARRRGQPAPDGAVYRDTVRELEQGIEDARADALVARRAVEVREEAVRRGESDLADLNIQGVNLFRPRPNTSTPPPAGGGGGGRAPTERDPKTGYTAAQMAALERAGQYVEREAQRTAEREQRELERREERNNRVTDRIVDYSAERFADLFDKNGRGWEGMLQTLERTAKSTMARIAAELVLRPIIAPIVSALGLGALGSGNGGFSGIGGVMGGGGGDLAGGGGGGSGGLMSLLGLGRSAYSAYSSLGGGGSSGGGLLGGLMSTPIWTSGGGWFGAPAVASGGFLPAGASSMGASALPGISSATTGVGGAATASLGSVLGAGAAGAGIGFAGGSMLGQYLAGNSPARRQNAQFGAGGGALAGAAAGAAIGSVVPGIGTVIGAFAGGVIGGLGGGAGGGLIGPSGSFSGGDVGIGVGADGQLRVTGSGGKRWDAGGAIEDTQRQLDGINALLRGAGVSISGIGEGTLGWQGSGQSRNVFGPTEIFSRIRPGLSASNANLSQVLGSGRIGSFDELGQVAAFITQIYEPLNKARDYTKDYAAAIGAQLAVYDQAITKARELGLAETGLIAARERAQTDLLRQRNTDVYTQQETLRIQELRLSGNPADQRRADMMDFNLRFGRGDQDLQDFLRASGYGDETDLFQDTLGRYRRITEIERARARDAAAERAGGSGRSLMEDLTVGGLGGLSPAARYAAGLRVLQDARRSGSLDRLTAAARTILPVARDFLGTSERFGALTADIGRDVRALGGDPVGLGVFLEGQAAGNQALERIYGLNNLQLTELKSMRAEISRLNSVLTTLMQRG